MASTEETAMDKGEDTWFWDWDEKLASISVEHAEFQQAVSNFVDKELLPNIAEWEDSGAFPRELHNKAYAAGVYGAGYPSEYGGTKPAVMDIWTRLIGSDQLGRVCAGGLLASLLTHTISLPPILMLGSEEQKTRYVEDIITGRKLCSLAITEPTGGSDVANIGTTAVRDGDVYIVNGNKAFISGGMNADYFTVAVRTGRKGLDGISLLMVHRDYAGVRTTRVKTQGWHCSTTTSIAFENVRVPAENLLGSENSGFLPIMMNFNNERYSMAVAAARMARCCLEDSIRYARVRKTFGKALIRHQVIRHKMVEMARHVLATHSMIMSLSRELEGEQASPMRVGGQASLTKVQATRTLEFCAREASQILGGRSYVRGGSGGRIERCYREVRVYAIGGGSEEIMLELAAQMAKL